MTDKTDRGRRIVVGVDGSPGSKAALRWAITQARLTGAQVAAITAWQDPVRLGYTYGAPAMFEADTFQTIAEKVVGETAAEVADEPGEPADVSTQVVQGHPAKVLVDAAAGAGLLVVGNRGHGAFAGMLLGSVSQHCVQHSPCPVVVVPA